MPIIVGILEEDKLCSMEIQKRSHSEWGVREDFLKDERLNMTEVSRKVTRRKKIFPVEKPFNTDISITSQNSCVSVALYTKFEICFSQLE